MTRISKSKVCGLLGELRCATALEIAGKLGAPRKVVQTYLNRLAARGVIERRVLGRRAVIYCLREDEEDSRKPGNPPPVGGRRVTGLYAKTRERLTRTLEILQRDGCISVGALMRTLNVTHTKAYHMMHVLLSLQRGVKVVIGKTAVLCRDRAAAEEAIARLREAIHSLAVGNRMKYATPKKILQIATRDRNAYELLSRYIPLKRNADKFPPLALTFVKDVLESLYGEPLRRRNGRVYVVTPQPRPEHGFEIIDSVDRYTLAVSLPDDVVALQGADVNDVALQALEQLLQRYRP